MKTARLLLAALSLATLAACGTEPLTGSSPEKARRAITPGTGGTTTQSAPACAGTLVITIDQYGNAVETCVINDRGPLVGSGG